MPAFFLFFLLATLFLSACSSVNSNESWPALTQNDGTLYLAYGPGVAAFDIESGEELWKYPAEQQGTLLFFAPPTANDTQVIIGDYGLSGGITSPGVTVTVYGLDKNGNQRWKNDELLSDRVAAGAVQNEDTVFISTNDNFVFALDANNGSLKWQFETNHSIYATPILEGETLYVASLDKSIYALDTGSGAVQWQKDFAGAMMNSPVLVEGGMYVSSFDHTLHRLDLENKGDVVWDFTTDGFLWGGPTVSDGVVLVGDLEGTLYSVSAETGDQICKLATGVGSVQAPPVVVDGVAYFVLGALDAEDGEDAGTLFAMSVDDCQQQWIVSQRYPIFTPPVLVNDTIAIVPSNPEVSIHFYNYDGSPAGASLTPRSE